MLGIEEHLHAEQLAKLGLRFFFGAGDNRDMTRRVEMGASDFLPVRTYQLNRGRLENYLSAEVVRQGI